MKGSKVCRALLGSTLPGSVASSSSSSFIKVPRREILANKLVFENPTSETRIPPRDEKKTSLFSPPRHRSQQQKNTWNLTCTPSITSLQWYANTVGTIGQLMPSWRYSGSQIIVLFFLRQAVWCEGLTRGQIIGVKISVLEEGASKCCITGAE